MREKVNSGRETIDLISKEAFLGDLDAKIIVYDCDFCNHFHIQL